jgi:hypothetical protein
MSTPVIKSLDNRDETCEMFPKNILTCPSSPISDFHENLSRKFSGLISGGFSDLNTEYDLNLQKVPSHIESPYIVEEYTNDVSMFDISPCKNPKREIQDALL